jgi:hypothetical protein
MGNTTKFAHHRAGRNNKNGGVLELEFRTPKTATPKSLGVSADPPRSLHLRAELGVPKTVIALVPAPRVDSPGTLATQIKRRPLSKSRDGRCAHAQHAGDRPKTFTAGKGRTMSCSRPRLKLGNVSY